MSIISLWLSCSLSKIECGKESHAFGESCLSPSLPLPLSLSSCSGQALRASIRRAGAGRCARRGSNHHWASAGPGRHAWLASICRSARASLHVPRRARPLHRRLAHRGGTPAPPRASPAAFALLVPRAPLRARLLPPICAPGWHAGASPAAAAILIPRAGPCARRYARLLARPASSTRAAPLLACAAAAADPPRPGGGGGGGGALRYGRHAGGSGGGRTGRPGLPAWWTCCAGCARLQRAARPGRDGERHRSAARSRAVARVMSGPPAGGVHRASISATMVSLIMPGCASAARRRRGGAARAPCLPAGLARAVRGPRGGGEGGRRAAGRSGRGGGGTPAQWGGTRGAERAPGRPARSPPGSAGRLIAPRRSAGG